MMTEESILDARLAEIDRRLQRIQTGLVGEAEEAVSAAPAPAPVDPSHLATLAELIADLRAVTAAHERLLESARELLSALAEQLARGPAAPAAPPLHAVPVPPRPDSAPDPVAVAAGPFGGTDALRRFEQTLSALPEVRDVAVREFVGADRAIVDVHLSEPTA